MKKLFVLILAIICVMMLYGCADALFTTTEYRAYLAFAEKHNEGMGPQAILKELGCPDGYYDAQGNYQSIPSAEQGRFVEILLEDSGSAWLYECWKRADPADPYRLKITFNAEGKSESATLTLVPGG